MSLRPSPWPRLLEFMGRINEIYSENEMSTKSGLVHSNVKDAKKLQGSPRNRATNRPIEDWSNVGNQSCPLCSYLGKTVLLSNAWEVTAKNQSEL